MNTVMDKLAAVLGEQAFYDEYKNVQDPDEIIAAIQNKVPEATKEEIDQFLTCVSEQLQNENGELNEADLENVAGGFAITLTVAGVITAVKCCAAAGALIGAAVWYWKNRK